MKTKGSTLSLGLIFASVALAACGARPETRGTVLLDRVRKHHENLRWENYGPASNDVTFAYRPDWETRLAETGRISEFEVGALRMIDPPGDDAWVSMRVQALRMPDLTVRTFVWHEHWEREGDNWSLTEIKDPEP